MKLICAFFVLLIGFTIAADTSKTVSHYKELGCKLVYSKLVPEQVERGDCPILKSEPPENKCIYKGKEYEVGQYIENGVTHECSVGCICSKQYDDSVEFSCAQVECPEDFEPYDNKTCIKQYSRDGCCSVKEVCDEEEKRNLAICEWDGMTYREGEKFYPNGACYSCICSKDFNNTLDGPWCKNINCGIELFHSKQIHERCAPVYFESSKCCPIEWNCYKESDVIQNKASVKSNNSDLQCQYGNYTLDIGDEIKGTEKCLVCKCQIPPLVTCVKSYDC